MSDTYRVGYTCKNCNASKNYDIPKGTTTFEFKEKTACTNCGIKKLEAQKDTFLE